MQALVRSGILLLLCTAAVAPAAAAIGEVAQVEGDVLTVRHYALSELPVGAALTVKRVIHDREAHARATVVSTDRTAATARLRLEAPRPRATFAAGDCVMLILPSGGQHAMAPVPASADRAIPQPRGTALAPSQPPAAGMERSFRLPMLSFPLGDMFPHFL